LERIAIDHHWDVMPHRSLSARLLRPARPSPALGIGVAIGSVAAATGVIYPLRDVAPVVSLGVVYVLAVVVVATFWGWALGVATAVASALAFNFFHLPPLGRFALADSRDWVALSAFVAVAVATGLVAELARARALDADQRRREADLAAEMAQTLLGATDLGEALAVTAQRLAGAIRVSSAAIELGDTVADPRRIPFALEAGGERVGTLVLPASLPESERTRVQQRIVPPLASILAAALHRAELQREVVETAALRRSDEMKTAVLRSVSHDLRTPITAILTAAGALSSEQPPPETVREASDVVLEAGTRLWRLVDKLLDLSVLQAGSGEPRREWYSVEEVLQEAIEQVSAPRRAQAQGRPDEFRLSADRDMPLLRGDPSQLERAFANVLENAARYSGGQPVSVRARAVGERIRVRVVDQGPGISPSEHERVFSPFYRSPGSERGHSGAGLGLAIARGFVEANGGSIGVESLPGQGTSFVVELPLDAAGPPREVGHEGEPVGRGR
jgi:two-component system sensor histidine kinase KdpD